MLVSSILVMWPPRGKGDESPCCGKGNKTLSFEVGRVHYTHGNTKSQRTQTDQIYTGNYYFDNSHKEQNTWEKHTHTYAQHTFPVQFFGPVAFSPAPDKQLCYSDNENNKKVGGKAKTNLQLVLLECYSVEAREPSVTVQNSTGCSLYFLLQKHWLFIHNRTVFESRPVWWENHLPFWSVLGCLVFVFGLSLWVWLWCKANFKSKCVPTHGRVCSPQGDP